MDVDEGLIPERGKEGSVRNAKLRSFLMVLAFALAASFAPACNLSIFGGR